MDPKDTEKPKGTMTPREAADVELPATREAAERGRAAPETEEDRREEEGWSQPESSAVKTPEPEGR